MVPTSCVVLRGGLAVAAAVLASSLSGTIAVAQQIAVNVEGQAAQEASPDEEQPDDAYARQIVPFYTSEAPGTIIIDTGQRYLYLVQPNDRAIRYGIGVGRLAKRLMSPSSATSVAAATSARPRSAWSAFTTGVSDQSGSAASMWASR
jgi:lipoprotein-anchoring transpeptidase ErfK/SrfK